MKNSRTWLAGLGALCGLMASAGAEEMILTDFERDAGTQGWAIEDDGVMGGVSRGTFKISEEGHAVFAGEVSLDNNGGFSSLQYYFDPIDVSAYRTAVFRVKGDGKQYRFLVESSRNAWHYYEGRFDTSGEWQTVEIPFSAMVPHRRGDQLERANYAGDRLAMVRFMIANGRAESFRLELDRVWLR